MGKLRSTAKLRGFKRSDWPILAKGKVRHAGEPVAMAIGSTPAESLGEAVRGGIRDFAAGRLNVGRAAEGSAVRSRGMR